MSEIVRLRIHKLANGSIILATILGEDISGNLSDSDYHHPARDYDATGAMYYVIAVICLYGFSIIMMIGSLVRKNKEDQQAHSYMDDMARIRRMEKRQEKFRTRLVMQNRRLGKLFGGRSDLGSAARLAEHRASNQSLVEISHSADSSAHSTPYGSCWSIGPDREEDCACTTPLLSPKPPHTPPAPGISLGAQAIPEIRIQLATPVGVVDVTETWERKGELGQIDDQP